MVLVIGELCLIRLWPLVSFHFVLILVFDFLRVLFDFCWIYFSVGLFKKIENKNQNKVKAN
jgi:hypothetical protein